jgi:hypothetical protein
MTKHNDFYEVNEFKSEPEFPESFYGDPLTMRFDELRQNIGSPVNFRIVKGELEFDFQKYED